MAVLNDNYEVKTDSHTGLSVILRTGRCVPSDVAGLKKYITRRYELVVLPQAGGAVLKALDGTRPRVQKITVSTTGQVYRCVLVDAVVEPLAPVQTGGPNQGSAVLRFVQVWQQVGGAV